MTFAEAFYVKNVIVNEDRSQEPEDIRDVDKANVSAKVDCKCSKIYVMFIFKDLKKTHEIDVSEFTS